MPDSAIRRVLREYYGGLMNADCYYWTRDSDEWERGVAEEHRILGQLFLHLYDRIPHYSLAPCGWPYGKEVSPKQYSVILRGWFTQEMGEV